MRQLVFAELGETHSVHMIDETQPTTPDARVLLGSTNTGLIGLFHNSPFLVAVLCFAVAQLAKFVLTYYETKELHWERLVGSGGMPSAHSAFVTGLAASVAIRDGTNSSTFAVALVFAIIVMYDAVGLRLHSGRHAAALNAIISELPPDHPVSANGVVQLRESLGHTPVQVAAGGTLGLVLALLIQGAIGPAHAPLVPPIVLH